MLGIINHSFFLFSVVVYMHVYTQKPGLGMSERNKVLVIGLEGASPDLLFPLASKGALPTINDILREITDLIQHSKNGFCKAFEGYFMWVQTIIRKKM